ncbi:MAG: hypothetical protein FK734_06175 [Asgard group archaeon]|nr:hypothetical protein [Asgard group archaeon]
MKNKSLEVPQIPKILTKRFNKINDPNYSLFENELRSHRFMKNFTLYGLAIGLPLFIIGLYVIIRHSILGIIPLTFGGLGVMVMIYLPIMLIDRKKFNTILHLKETKQMDKLLELAKKYSISFGYLDQELARLSTYALIDFRSPEIAIILADRFQFQQLSQVRALLPAFYLLAKKMGYQDHITLFQAITSGRKLSTEEVIVDNIDKEVVIPITKVYFLEEIPVYAKCMVSGLRLDFYQDIVVVCPYCSAFAKKDLLAAWLKEKNSCPVCQRELTIDDCPEVRLPTSK